MVVLRSLETSETQNENQGYNYIVKASIETQNNIRKDQIIEEINTTFIEDLNKVIQTNGDLTEVRAATIKEMIVSEEHKGRLPSVYSQYKLPL